MSQPTYPIVGAEGTGCYPRLELRDLQCKPIHFSLFIRALTRLENLSNTQDRDKPNSWWQIGAIHGLPYIPWSGDPEGPQKEAPESQWGGYCYHGSALFPPWHRVLLLLVEQAIVNEAITIATDFEAREPATRAEGWLQAAKELRFPFWDWTKPETAKEGIPKICQDTVVSIVNPGGSQSQVPNPLNHYKYAAPPGAAQGLEYMGTWERTYRWADQDLSPTKEDYAKAVKAFKEGGKLDLGGETIDLQPVTWLREKVAGLFKYDLTLSDPAYGPNMWAYFSNTGAEQSGVSPPMAVMPSSIEESHNTLHVNVGGNGSMSANEYAGFDPIFFLHHSNVDRIYAFWEYLYPEYWIGNGWKNSQTGQIVPFVTDNGTFFQNAGATFDHATPLHPFRNKALYYWTPEQIRGLLSTSPVNKYYTYPPIIDPITGVKVQVDCPYDTSDLAVRKQYQQALLNEWGRDLGTICQSHQNLPFSLPSLDLLLKIEEGIAKLRQFVIVGRIPEFAFRGSYRLEIYVLPKVVQLASGLLKAASGLLQQATGSGVFGIGQQGAEAVEEAIVHVVNDITVLGRSDPDRCAACRERRSAGSQIRGHMHLDPRVILYLFASLDPVQIASITGLDDVATLIHGSFGMRLVRPDGTKLAAAEPDFAGESPPDASKLPSFSLYSHIVTFDANDPAGPVQFCEHTSHGTFGSSHGWKTF